MSCMEKKITFQVSMRVKKESEPVSMCVSVLLFGQVILRGKNNHSHTHTLCVIRGSTGWGSISLDKPCGSHAGSQTVIITGGDRQSQSAARDGRRGDAAVMGPDGRSLWS